MDVEPLPVDIVIRVDSTGKFTVEASGPYRGKDGLLILLDEAKKLVEQMS